MYYKAPDNSLHCIEPDFSDLLPAGSVPISETEAEALRPVAPPPDTAALRRAAYAAEADPLFFKHQRGETTWQAWIDKIAEIKARYPLPGDAP